MRTALKTAIATLLLLVAVLGLSACERGSDSQGSSPPASIKAEKPEDLLTVKDVESVLGLEDIKRSEVKSNPQAEYQALFETTDGGKLLILNVLKGSEWETLQSIGETEAIAGLGDEALRSDSYGVVFRKGGRVCAVGGFGFHSGASKNPVADEKVLELALLISSRM